MPLNKAFAKSALRGIDGERIKGVRGSPSLRIVQNIYVQLLNASLADGLDPGTRQQIKLALRVADSLMKSLQATATAANAQAIAELELQIRDLDGKTAPQGVGRRS